MVKKPRAGVVGGEPFDQRAALFVGEVRGGPGPAEPPPPAPQVGPAEPLGQAAGAPPGPGSPPPPPAPQVGPAEPVGQAAGAPLELDPLRPSAHRHREPVGDDDDPGVHQVHARTRPSRASSSSPIVIAAWTRPTWV